MPNGAGIQGISWVPIVVCTQQRASLSRPFCCFRPGVGRFGALSGSRVGGAQFRGFQGPRGGIEAVVES